MKGIAIPYPDIEMIDIDFLDLHSKAMCFDGDKQEVIVLVPDQELINTLNRLKKEGKLRYRELSDDEFRRYAGELLYGD